MEDGSLIPEAILEELPDLIDHHNCRVHLLEGDLLKPVALRGKLPEYSSEHAAAVFTVSVGEGIVGRVAERNLSVLIGDALEVGLGESLAGRSRESILAAPISVDGGVLGVLYISRPGSRPFQEDELRTLELVAAHASVAFESSMLRDDRRKGADAAKLMLEFADAISRTPFPEDIAEETAETAARILEVDQASVWWQLEPGGDFFCGAYLGSSGISGAGRMFQSGLDAAAGERLLR